MKIEVGTLCAQQLSRLRAHYSENTKSPVGVKITDDQAAEAAIAAAHKQIFGYLGPHLGGKQETGGGAMDRFAVQLETARGWETKSLHPDMAAASAAIDRAGYVLGGADAHIRIVERTGCQAAGSVDTSGPPVRWEFSARDGVIVGEA